MIFDDLADIDDLLTSVGEITKASDSTPPKAVEESQPPASVVDQEPVPVKVDDLPLDLSDDKSAVPLIKEGGLTLFDELHSVKEDEASSKVVLLEKNKSQDAEAGFTPALEEDIGDFLNTIDLGASSKTDKSQKEATKSSALVKRGMLEAESAEGKEDDVLTFLEESTLHRPRSVPDITKPWMKHHEFLLVRTVEEVHRIVDECIKAGFCSLDLETTGLDNRINWVNGKPETVDKIVGFCISYDGVAGYYIPVRHNPTDGGPSLNVEPIQEVEAAISRLCHVAIPEGTPEAIRKDPLSYKCERPKVIIGFWNAQFDQEFLFPITGIDWWHPESFEDGMLACFTIFAGDKRIGLKPKAKELLRDPENNPYEMIELKELFVGKRKKIRFATLAPDEPGVLHYVGADAICTYLLCQLPNLVRLCHEKHEFTYRIEKQVTCVLRVVERNRVRIARELVREILVKQNEERDRLLERIQRFAKGQGLDNLDPNSPKQLSEFLFGPRPKGLDISPKPEKNEASGQYKTDGDTLEALAKLPDAASILKDIVKYREAEKFIGTYLEGLVNNPDENSELRFSFKQTGAASGRFSAPQGDPEHGYSGVPVHGIPNGSEVRRAFEARPGYVTVKADYAGEELRIAANVSGEEVWINEFLHGSGDLHSITARAFFGKQEVTKEERSAGKVANFALLYGGGPQSIMRATGCDKMEARRRKQAFDKAVPTFAKWIKIQHAKVKKDLGVKTAFDRWLSIPDANTLEEKIRAACERYSVNYRIQGSGADIMKIVMILLHKEFHKRNWLKNGGDDSIRMLLTVHDEIVFEIRYERVAESIPLITDIMEAPWHMPKEPPWRVPLVVEPLVGFNWASGYKAERMPKDYKPKDTEVVINNFVYGTTRKPRVNKEGEIIEALDRDEEKYGKVFRVKDPPWLMGKNPIAGTDTPSGGPLVEKAKEAEPLEKEVKPVFTDDISVGGSISPTTVQAEDSEMKELELGQPEATLAPENKILKLGINQLNAHTVRQVFEFVWDSMGRANPGSFLYLTDIVGNTVVPLSLNLRVNEDYLIAKLREHNLLSNSEKMR